MGGPIIKDKLFFSIAPEFQQQNQPSTGPYIGQPETQTPKPPATQLAVDSLTNILKSQYGFADPGNGGVIKNENPLANMFARFDLINLPNNSRLVARWNYVNAQQDVFSRSNTRLNLSNNGYNFQSVTNSGLAQLFSDFGRYSNELLTGYTTIRDQTHRSRRRSSSSRASQPQRRHGQIPRAPRTHRRKRARSGRFRDL
jgi:hypothetical protein